MKKKLLAAVFGVALLSLPGCASLISGTSQDLAFDSVPAGASVQVAGKSCTTPCKLNLEKGQAYQVTFSKKGYKTQQLSTAKQFDGVAILNMLGLVGWVIDLSTGAVSKIEPSALTATLEH
ncbi:MAG: PEGA domain-containing protein [Bdellovibrionaceae bacterium]|nr:PEGA domain-containing protein [Bdellovibrionales bacterium]MCB9254047.1 PEGA domain-containing protein [Pseudobdellovibrionaceae bacterium]